MKNHNAKALLMNTIPNRRWKFATGKLTNFCSSAGISNEFASKVCFFK